MEQSLILFAKDSTRAFASIIPTSATVAVAVNRSEFEVISDNAPPLFQLADNDFQVFQLPEQFSISLIELDTRWKNLQRQTHPDQFVRQDTASQRLAMQWTVRINEAYQRLKDPLKRAAYLCELRGVPIDAENNTAMPADFLMQQMQWREDLDDASHVEAIEQLHTQVMQSRTLLLNDCAQDLDQHNRPQSAVQHVRTLMFLDRFIQDIEKRIDAMT
ncbi:MAG: Fe-S protein assembly co-chaperone HscB [Limnohabitans sp.]|nr:Fe-S protein assembly co-chaperone HscB [Limnohabitans sp.]